MSDARSSAEPFYHVLQAGDGLEGWIIGVRGADGSWTPAASAYSTGTDGRQSPKALEEFDFQAPWLVAMQTQMLRHVS